MPLLTEDRPFDPHRDRLFQIPEPGFAITNLYEQAVEPRPLPVEVDKSNATGRELLSNGKLGADLLWVPPNDGFAPHVHPGDHLLLCLDGTGTIEFNGHTYQVRPGDLYFIEGNVPHAVGAGPKGHLLVAIGSPHSRVDSTKRMRMVDSTVLADATALSE